MRNFLIIFIIFLFFSCSEIQISNDWYYLHEIPKQLINEKDKIEIFIWVVDNINYKMYANGFHSAQKTLNEKTGNCANLTLLTLALDYKINKRKGELVYCRKKEGLHYTSRMCNKIIEPNIIEIYEVISFDDIANYIEFRK